ncbi:MBOAT family protein [Bacillus cereus]|uniref:MBOAT family protein n=2 Tax=Bacillus cereus group TaxID=86661 RepID=A0AB34D0G8_BACCE|nr:MULTISPECIES: MBOAT family protein [Bacillus cereus group]HDR5348909.1 MBOAT family protein [Bacillus thuringiensis]KAB2492069.1 MBOAT family protein [Bacillus cereus]MCH5459829.1 MBOAT family protein [Bacillus cereus]MCU5022744.1 MBOAT family protein [Bacillus cereus]MCU5641504.1 MBOAT family protein [Bacillus cereus]
MVFSNLVFLCLFLPAVLLIYYAVRKELQNIVLLFFSLVFYAWGEPIYVFLMLFSILVNYWFGILLGNSRFTNGQRKLLLTFAIVMNIAILGYFKYANFLVDNINSILHTNIVLEKIPLPIGISFFTFHAMSYIIDIYKKKVDAQRNIFDLALYFTVFPQLVAGPIVRYNTISHQLHQRTVDAGKFSEGVRRFIIGLGKKVLIANQLGVIADEIFSMNPSDMSVSLAWMGAIAYTLQIYFDFSGYSDMAIGLGKMFGFDFLENFNYPYISKSISEFWRRWHISLGSWFRDYVYIPLGGNRVTTWKVYRNLFIVWGLTGFWHGASWTFMIWGIYYGILIALEKAGLENLLQKLWSPLQHIYVMFLVIIGWVFFRADNFSYCFEFLKSMFGFNSPLTDINSYFYIMNYWGIFLLAIITAAPVFPWLQKMLSTKRFAVLSPVYYLSILVIVLVFLTNATYNPFIYFRF